MAVVPSIRTANAILTPANLSLAEDGTVAASAFILSVGNLAGRAPDAYAFRDMGLGGGHFVLNGVAQPANTWIVVAAADLGRLGYVGGHAAGTDMIWLAVSANGTWSPIVAAAASTLAPPVVTAGTLSVSVGGTAAASSLIAAVADPAGRAITAFRFMNTGTDGGALVLNGATQAAGQWVTVAAADLGRLNYAAGTAAGQDAVKVEAFDGVSWSAAAIATAVTTGGKADPFASITDATVHADVARLGADGVMSYADMLFIVRDAAAGGMTAGRFASLQALDAMVKAGTTVHASGYVGYISDALIAGNPFNATWTGGASAPVALGNLSATSTEDQADKLIAKWFAGTDDPSLRNTGAAGYVADTRPLFGPGGVPSYTDVNQGTLGDCYFVAALAETAAQDPGAIEGMFTDNGNGSYGVRFFGADGKAEYVTVDRTLADLPAGYQWANGSPLAFANGPVAWAGLAEKAYAELNAEGGLHRTAGNEYDLLAGGTANALADITGKSVSAVSTGAVKGALAAGQEVLMGTPNTVSLANLVANHMFEVIAYDTGTDSFELHNPWGTATNAVTATFWASAADLSAQRVSMFSTVGASPADTRVA